MRSDVGIVIGGGIAGLAFAAAMHRLGRDTIVLEAAPALRAYGSGLVLGPTAMMALARLGLREQVIATGQRLLRGGLTDLAMRPLSHDVFGYFSARSGEPFVGIERSELIRMLAERVPQYRTDARCTAIHDGGAGVTIDLASGERIEAPWAILADGIRSVGRALMGGVGTRDAGQWCWRGIAAGVDLEARGDEFLEAWGSEWRFGFTPVGGGRTYWFVTQRDSAAEEGPKLAPEERAAKLHKIAQRFPPIVGHLIAGTPPDMILENRLEDLGPLPHWHSGNMICIGDAAHAMTPNLGQGATQSLEDAVILARTMAGGNDPKTAFAAFEAIRKPRAQRTVREARAIGNLAHCPDWAAPMRNAVMRRLPRALSIRQIAWLYEDAKLSAELGEATG